MQRILSILLCTLFLGISLGPAAAGDCSHAVSIEGKKARKQARYKLCKKLYRGDKREIFKRHGYTPNRLRVDHGELAGLRAETVEQRAKIEAFDARVAEVRKRLESVGDFERKVRVIANLPGSVATGGADVVEVGPSEGGDLDAARQGEAPPVKAGSGSPAADPGRWCRSSTRSSPPRSMSTSTRSPLTSPPAVSRLPGSCEPRAATAGSSSTARSGAR